MTTQGETLQIVGPKNRLPAVSLIEPTQSGYLDTGLVGVNHPMVATPETPFGGVNESGYGSEGGIEGLDAFLRTKFITEMGV